MKLKIIACLVILCSWALPAAEPGEPVRAELNGLRVAIDPDSGGLRELEYDGVKFLQAGTGSASLLDAAYPGYGFEPLRLGARHSRDARVEVADGGILITWPSLGMSRKFEPIGSVAAMVRIRPAADGRSLTLAASVENRSELTIPQVLFPDLAGLQPFGGLETTELRTCGGVQRPFRDLALPEDEGRWYASRRNWLTLKSGAYDKSMAARWLDLGSLKGGFSLFPKLWSWGPLTESGEPTSDRVLLQLSQVDRTLRLMCEHKTLIRPGEKWSSPEYVLTPHRNGWAKGIEPFRAWIKENVQRPHPLPKHLRQTLGYRSVWLAQQYAVADAAAPTIVWRFRDLPGLADECRAHGLNEMVVWLWGPWEIPQQPSPELGTLAEFNRAIAECRAKGVNVSLFVSVMTMLNPIPAKYGQTDGREDWGYHTDFIPMLRPYYGKASRGSFADPNHPGWQADVTASLLQMVERGWTSITWDQAMHKPAAPNLETVFATVRAAASEKNPAATFAGECLNNLDLDSRWLDYTWNWALFDQPMDWRALVNAYPTPRFNVNVGTSPRAVKQLFADHLFLNVLPSKPDGINGSARITDHPELATALTVCAHLHAQFQTYLEDGRLIGDNFLSEPCREARVNGYLLPDTALIVVLNTGTQPRSISFAMAMAPWLRSPSGRYAITAYDESGINRSTRSEVAATWKETTGVLAPNELALFEVVPEK
ncbi:MAG: hypothetical protein IT579_06840 [Verrucomicrobia subdivision 3 bacterium]|nr:hypothetical protein [Limisphaerales bacterium]